MVAEDTSSYMTSDYWQWMDGCWEEDRAKCRFWKLHLQRWRPDQEEERKQTVNYLKYQESVCTQKPQEGNAVRRADSNLLMTAAKRGRQNRITNVPLFLPNGMGAN